MSVNTVLTQNWDFEVRFSSCRVATPSHHSLCSPYAHHALPPHSTHPVASTHNWGVLFLVELQSKRCLHVFFWFCSCGVKRCLHVFFELKISIVHRDVMMVVARFGSVNRMSIVSAVFWMQSSVFGCGVKISFRDCPCLCLSRLGRSILIIKLGSIRSVHQANTQ